MRFFVVKCTNPRCERLRAISTTDYSHRRVRCFGCNKTRLLKNMPKCEVDSMTTAVDRVLFGNEKGAEGTEVEFK